MIVILNILIVSFSFAFDQEVKDYSDIIQKGDSCLKIEDYSTAVEFYSQIDAESMNFSSEEQRMQFYLNFSDASFIIGEYPLSLSIYKKLKTFATQNDYRFYEGKASTGMAHSLWRMTDNVNSIKEILNGIEIFGELKDTSNLIIASNILAGIYVSIDKYNDAEKIYQRMLENAIQSNDSANIADNFEYLGVVDFFRADYRNAIINYEKSLAINQKLNNYFKLAINISNIAEPYMEMGEYQKALQMLHRAKNLQEKNEFKSVLIFSYLTLGKVHTRIQSYDSGLYYYEKSLHMMVETSETRDEQEVYRLIAENYAKQGKFKKAYEYHKLHSAEKDSLIAEEETTQLEEIKTRYEVEGKIKENENLVFQNSQKENELAVQKALIQLQFTIGVLIILFLITSLILSYRLYRFRQKLINANNSKDKLFAIIAHDLKGPIGNIGAMLNLLQREQDERRKSQYLDYLIKSIANLSALTNQLLSWTFSQKGDFNFKIEKLSAKILLNRAIDLFAYQLSDKNIRINNTISDDIFVLADENALLTIFRNILSNAVKFTKNNGVISLEADDQKKFIEIRIKDNGVGMTQAAIDKVLEGKHVVSSQGTAAEKGNGLGFSIVIGFVERLDGGIFIESDGNSGTTVILKLNKAN